MFEINGVSWKVKLVSTKHPALKRSNGTYTLGSCNNKKKVIYLSKNIPTQKLSKVLCHEITHAAMFSYNIFLSLEQEEIVANLISSYGEEIVTITNRIFKNIKK